MAAQRDHDLIAGTNGPRQAAEFPLDVGSGWTPIRAAQRSGQRDDRLFREPVGWPSQESSEQDHVVARAGQLGRNGQIVVLGAADEKRVATRLGIGGNPGVRHALPRGLQRQDHTDKSKESHRKDLLRGDNSVSVVYAALRHPE